MRPQPQSRYWVVELHPDLSVARTTRAALFLSMRHLAGVKGITDLAAIASNSMYALGLLAELETDTAHIRETP